MNIELTRFRVKEGKSQIVEEWMNFGSLSIVGV